jgi:hypothetical protein
MSISFRSDNVIHVGYKFFAEYEAVFSTGYWPTGDVTRTSAAPPTTESSFYCYRKFLTEQSIGDNTLEDSRFNRTT